MQSQSCLLLWNTLEGRENAGEEEDKVWERSEVKEGQTPGGAEQTAEAPDAEEGHAVLLPLVPVANLSVDQEEHHQACRHQQGQHSGVGEVVSQQSRGVGLHPAPGHAKSEIMMEAHKGQKDLLKSYLHIQM